MKGVVIGGGIVGLSSALELAERGVDVTVCEQGSIGTGSTERSVGGIRAQFSTPINVELSRESMRVWNEFTERFDAEIDYRKTGYLFLARSEETAAAFEERVAMQNDRGVRSEVLDPAEACEICSGIDPDQFVAATYSPTDGFADPHLALQAYARAAAAAGVDVRTQTPVSDVIRAGDRDRGDGTGGARVMGVETPDGRLDADIVVNAAGPWASDIAAMADVFLPITPKRRQIAVVQPETPVPETDPLTVDLESGSYFRPDRDGDALVGGHFADNDPASDPDGYPRSMDFEWSIDALEAAAEWTTYFGPESAVKRGWAGLYAVTPDDTAIVEETIPGFITAAGFSGHGFQHAPATGQLVAELAVDGEASLLGIDALSSDRFEGTDEEKAAGRTERNVV
ncbi:NAD(P)/FAD-dependent oxidoreductase [Natrialba asiatica]|uniref:FAD dependent oxidoreductase n=1 Tax=Natrialba asiatica (strain ATCC 700177 / DSM 12278 / JCM 9576 / FERM P-10747 / NBRC 102637 / 172P1) TaxID=29540 RepID=M0AUB6_NATA1|nr:FAD-dependent oxidoreductase [Natrialba asiatica]ELZ00964.1 FAD dependent oxidoreductase [Natrialba asiatica DSM 12278]